MAYGTPSVAAATTPTVLSAFFTHYLSKHSRKRRARKDGKQEDPATVDLAYDEGIKVIRSFLEFAAKHTLEEIQSFTAMHVPSPTWVKKTVVVLPYKECIDRAERLLEKQLLSYGPASVERVGGMNWWKVRGKELEGEWIEMKKDYVKRKAAQDVLTPEEYSNGERVMLYIHGGAYFFSSLDTHRYQIQRHVRKLGGRAFAPAYRLAPQYPFPCGLLDSLAAYLYLIEPPPGATHRPILPSSIVFAGDSAGGGCVVSLLIMIRDLGLPMPAGADLLSPWVDLSHSFPSILRNERTDYIPNHGFHFKPSLAWPPVKETALTVEADVPGEAALQIDEQIQLYCPNVLIQHPLVSPVCQGSLGGLCPLLVHSGGGELLSDEQVYFAHKAANPSLYPPSPAVVKDYPILAEQLTKYKPTRVQLQVFDGCAHVVPTLSMTLPAKYMYRSAANFNLWAIKAAKAKQAARELLRQEKEKRQQQTNNCTARTDSMLPPQTTNQPSRSSTLASGTITPISILTVDDLDAALHQHVNNETTILDDAQSEASSSDSSDSEDDNDPTSSKDGGEKITVTGTLPTFGPGKIIRQRVTCRGKMRAMEPESEIAALNIPPVDIGRVHISGPVSKWLEVRQRYESKYSKDLEKFRKIKADDYQLAKVNGFLTRQLQGENPPQCALASWYDTELARKAGKSVDETSTKTNTAVMLYMKMSQKHDEEQVGDYTDSSQKAVDEVVAQDGEKIKRMASRPQQV